MNNNFQALEILGVIAIISIQAYVFISTLNKILKFKKTFSSSASIVKLQIPVSHLNDYTPAEIMENYSLYLEPEFIDDEEVVEEDEEFDDEDVDDSGEEDINDNLEVAFNSHLEDPSEVEETKKDIHLLIPGNNVSSLFAKIISSINVYLIKNRGAASDFHLIKDVVERNTDTKEGEISHSISVPLYLGLLGTMFGIVFGLFNISDLGDSMGNESVMSDGISVLLGGVKIAMIASFTGLAFTVINSSWLFKNSKFFVETRKNDFYTFLQMELLPVLNQNVNSTLYSLQTNLLRFNDEFTVNINRLGGIMGKNYDALIAQEKILSTIDKLDVVELAKANVKVLRELQSSTQKFSEFNAYLGNMNEMVENSRNYVGQMNEMLARTNNFNMLANKIIEAFEFNKKLQEFLQHHYSTLENTQQIFDEKLTGVNDVLSKSLDQLKDFVQSKIIEIQQISLKEVEVMREEYPERWKKLDNLILLNSLNSNVNDIRSSSASQTERIKNELTYLNQSFNKAIVELEAIKKNGLNKKGVRKSLFKLFRKKEKVNEG